MAEGHSSTAQAKTPGPVPGRVDLHLRCRGLQLGAHTEPAEAVSAAT
jgi:hypothetical protein